MIWQDHLPDPGTCLIRERGTFGNFESDHFSNFNLTINVER